MTKNQKIAIGAVLIVSAGALIYSLATYKGQSNVDEVAQTPTTDGQTLGQIVTMEQEGTAPLHAPVDPNPVTFGTMPGTGVTGVPPVASATSTITGPGTLAPMQNTPQVGAVNPISGTGSEPVATTDQTATSAPVTPVAAPVAVETTASYKVKKGDTLQGIAQRELGSANKWKEILVANPGLNPNKMKIGMSLVMPAGRESTASGPMATAQTQTRVAPSSVSTQSTQSTQAAATKNTITTKDGVKIYTVRERDTLRKISKDVYGNDAMWQNVFKANRDVIGSDPGRLEPGTILIIPTSGR